MEATPCTKTTEPQQARTSTRRRRSLISGLLPIVALLFLTCSVAGSAYRARHDAPTFAFILLAYADLLLLFACLTMFDGLGPGSPPQARRRLKVAVWVLATYLNLAFAWRVARIMNPALAAVVWAAAAIVTVGGFAALVLRNDG